MTPPVSTREDVIHSGRHILEVEQQPDYGSTGGPRWMRVMGTSLHCAGYDQFRDEVVVVAQDVAANGVGVLADRWTTPVRCGWGT